MKLYQAMIVIVLLGSSPLVFADGVSLYLPVNVDPVVEMDVERLMVYADISQLKRPYSIAIIKQGLAKIRETQPELYRRLSHTIDRYKAQAGNTHASARVFHTSEDDQSVNRVNYRGNSLDSHGELSFRSHINAANWLALSIGFEASEEVQQATGTLLSLGVDWAQVDMGYKEYWLSPFFGSSQLLSTQSQTLPSVSLSNNLPINFLGLGFNYQFFVAELSHQPTYYRGEFSDSGSPLLASAYFSVKPATWWELGVTRNFQFGGGEREIGLGALARAFYDPRGADNTGDSTTADNEAGNQIASLSSKMIFDGRVPFSLSAEIAGEDASNNKSYQLGNPAITGGIYFPAFFSQNVSFAYEYSSWDSSWYSHHLYEKGYSNEDYVLGHWAMQEQHNGGTAVPGSSHFINLQCNLPWRQALDIKLRTSENDGELYNPAWNIDLDFIQLFNNQRSMGLGAFFGQDSNKNSFVQFRISAKWR